MPRDRLPPQPRRLVAVDGALALIAVMVVVQMWLLTATLESYLAGHLEGVLPAFLAALVLFAGCAALGVFIQGIDAQERPR
jgi:hypothetical protein